MTWRAHPLVRLVVPGLPPSVNRTRRWSRGRGFDPANARALAAKADFERQVWAIFRQLYPGQPPLTAAVTLRAHYVPGSRRRMDGDNRDKALLDALTTARVWLDDSQVRRRDITLCDPDPGRPRTVVELWPWTATEAPPDGQ